MARYIGPKRRVERRENATLFGNEGWKKRAFPPGQHGASSKSRPSSYAIQFREKQKVKRMYGLLERQFRNTYALALKSPGNSGTRLLQLLELRLDNVVYKLGLAKNRIQARQFVTHGHVLVNGKKLDIPSYICSIGDQIEIKKKMIDNELMRGIKVDMKNYKIPSWLEELTNAGIVKNEPTRDQIDKSINERLIIELYSR
ncbi:30S ribosomal protein S4 [Candidatus Dojkabacteria bacterium]|nr:30S ribosomal protein S4 [Candidatus Dojkabacteria bacterium]